MKFTRSLVRGSLRHRSRPGHPRLRVESLESRLVPSHVIEAEPPGTMGLNNTLATAEYIPGFGTGRGEDPAADITGFTSSPPRTIAAAEDDGSIPLANPTGLVTEGTDFVVFTARVGDGPHGSAGTGSGDYDHYRFAARAGQLLTVDSSAAALGSSLDTVMGLYDSSGTLLASNDDAFNNPVSGHTTDSLLRFLVPADDTYSLVVFGKGSGFQADPFDSASGGGAASEGDYQLTIVLESPVHISQTEDDGALSLANETGLTAGAEGLVYATAVIGDGPDGPGDFDLYRLEAAAGQLISVDTDTPVPFVGLNTIVGIYDSAGFLQTFNDDFLTSDSFIRFAAPATGTYFVLVASVSHVEQQA
jgi:Bacterial pre-peptidase C-terminal domain